MKLHNSPADLDLLGRHLSAQLSLATPSLAYDVSERLRVARQRALASRNTLHTLKLSSQTTQINGNGTLTGSGDEGLNLWSILGSALPLLVLVLGLTAIGWVQQDDRANELAIIDAALLTDELPPDAYADAGFVQFLKQSSNVRAAND
jgi:hypothetical protein